MCKLFPKSPPPHIIISFVCIFLSFHICIYLVLSVLTLSSPSSGLPPFSSPRQFCPYFHAINIHAQSHTSTEDLANTNEMKLICLSETGLILLIVFLQCIHFLENGVTCSLWLKNSSVYIPPLSIHFCGHQSCSLI